METALTLIIAGIAGLGVALAYTIAGPKIRQRYHNDTLRTRSAWAFPYFLVQYLHCTICHKFFSDSSTPRLLYEWQEIKSVKPCRTVAAVLTSMISNCWMSLFLCCDRLASSGCPYSIFLWGHHRYAYTLLFVISNYHRYGRIDALYAVDIPSYILSQSLISRQIDPYYYVINTAGSVYIVNKRKFA